MSLARTLMVQGTSSSVGKSLLVTALCRIFRQQGLRVAPFKSQNMALNAAVTADGREIGRAQAVQAEAAGIEATVDMNPILLKPEGEARCQVVVMGRAAGVMSAAGYHGFKGELRQVLAASLQRLRAAYDLVVIEGAGSPAEINLREHEIVNMHVARIAEAPVLLAGDIDRGGVFASLVGTLELLEPADRARVAGFVVNKFRGDVALLRPGLDFLARRTGIPVLGVVPHVPRLRIADEDSHSLEERISRARATTGELDVAVVRLPRMSNHDDFAPLEHEPGVVVRFIDDAAAMPGADLVVLPGSKSTISDLQWLRRTGLAEALISRAQGGHPILGVCGGCQILGERIDDPDGVESDQSSAPGLSLLPLRTRFRSEKTTARVRARLVAPSLFGITGRWQGVEVEGYEIHAGEVARTDLRPAIFEIIRRNDESVAIPDGAAQESVAGTLIHGLFDNDAFRRVFLDRLRQRRGLTPPSSGTVWSRAAEFDRVATIVRESLDWAALCRIAGVADETAR